MFCLLLELNNPSDCLKWDNFCNSFDNGHHHKTTYLKAICHGLDQENNSLMCLDDNENIIGILPLVGIRSKIFGNQLISTPHLNYGGVLSNSDEATLYLYNVANEILDSKDYEKILIRSSSPLSEKQKKIGWAEQLHKVNMVYTLPDDIKNIGFGNAKKRAKLRSQCKLSERKAEENNASIEVSFGKEELVDDFYSVFSTHMRDLGTPVLGKDFFKNQKKSETPYEICIVYWNGEAVAAGWLFLHSSSYVSIPWASTLYKVNKFSINIYMYHQILNRLIDKGVVKFDFGRFTIAEGTYKFKEQWGATSTPCYWHVYEPGKSIEEMTSTSPSLVMKILVKLWKKTPLFITNKLGPLLIKQTAG